MGAQGSRVRKARRQRVDAAEPDFWVSFFASFGDQTAQNLANFSAIKQSMHPLFEESYETNKCGCKYISDDIFEESYDVNKFGNKLNGDINIS